MTEKLDLAEVRELLDEAKGQLISTADTSTTSVSSSTPTAAFIARQCLLRRIIEISDAAVMCINHGNPLGAMILVRAVLECTAVHHQLNREIISIGQGNTDPSDIEISRLLLGTKYFSAGDSKVDEETRMKNILTCLKHLNKEHNFVLDDYEFLCEFSHPNWAGTAGTFAAQTEDGSVTHFGRYLRDGEADLAALAINHLVPALAIFLSDYVHIKLHLTEFLAAFRPT